MAQDSSSHDLPIKLYLSLRIQHQLTFMTKTVVRHYYDTEPIKVIYVTKSLAAHVHTSYGIPHNTC